MACRETTKVQLWDSHLAELQDSDTASGQDWAKAQTVGNPQFGNVTGLATVADRMDQSGASDKTQRQADKVAKGTGAKGIGPIEVPSCDRNQATLADIGLLRRLAESRQNERSATRRYHPPDRATESPPARRQEALPAALRTAALARFAP